MINLIPTEEKKKMKSDFLVRVSVTSLIVLSAVILIGVVSLVPSYFHVIVKSNLANQKLLLQKNTPLPAVETEVMAQVDELNKKLQLIEARQQAKFLVSERVIRDVLVKKMPDIKINEISYDNSPTKGKEIRISGEASSRERLLLFRLALEKDGNFKKVDLPISNFVKGSNIIFSLTLILS